MRRNTECLFAQGAVLGFFASVFRPGLAPSLLRRCATDRIFETWPLPIPTETVAHELSVLQDIFADPTDAALAAIERDNAALFVGPEQAVPMWESVWRTKERLLFAGCTREVREAFARSGLETLPGPREPEDHLTFELSFLSALLVRAGQAVKMGDSAHAREDLANVAAFYENHPATWAFDCLREIGRLAATPFYQGAAVLCADSLQRIKILTTVPV